MAEKYINKHPSEIDMENDIYDLVALTHLKEEAEEENREFENSLKNKNLQEIIFELKEKIETKKIKCSNSVLLNKAGQSNDPEIQKLWHQFLILYKLINSEGFDDDKYN